MVSSMSSGTASISIGSDWVGRTVDGQFTLQRWLGGAGQSSVFLTQIGDPPRNAAIKLVPAGAADAESLLAQWKAAISLSHPHLLRLFYAGRCRLDGHDLLYAVTEYSEEFLSEILPARSLAPAEVQEMVGPILDALSWLHQQGLVHGGLKPSNVMVVNEQLKLSVARVQPAGTRGSISPSSDIHVAPDSAESMSPATDVWSLGVLIVEALTQQTPHRDGTRAADPLVPASVPEPFATIARECLRIYPARRCSLSDIRSYLAPPDETAPPIPAGVVEAIEPTPSAAPETPPASTPFPSAPAPESPPGIAELPSAAVPPKPVPVPASATAPRRSSTAPATAKSGARRPHSQNETVFATAALIFIAAIGVLTFIVPKHHASRHATQQSQPTVPPPPAASGPSVHGAVLQRSLPDVPKSASGTIRGHIVVVVRVQVDANGNVSGATFDYAGHSRYFANLALDAARNWKFQPAQINGRAVPSTWVLQFRFERTGNKVTSQETAP
jgi:TonB family protein